MKKKIKDLTLEETRKICGDNYCEICPLSYGLGKWCHRGKLEVKENEKNLNLENEVLVDE